MCRPLGLAFPVFVATIGCLLGGITLCMSKTEKRIEMPRPTKTLRRMKVNAAAAWKRGEKKEAYALWSKAAAGLKEHLEKKHNKKKAAES